MADKKKTPKEASKLFFDILKASVSGNPKPKPKKKAKK
jgi:hypothetical protein